MSCIQTGFNTFYYGVLSSLERTGYTFGFNVFLVGLHEFIGYSVAGKFPLIQESSFLHCPEKGGF